jgi:transcriptional regulator with XRE-family HTH domain
VKINEHDAKLFGRNLCLARRRRGFSQDRLAQRTGLCRDTIYKIEMGQRAPRLDTLLAIADALGIDAAELLDGLRPLDDAERQGPNPRNVQQPRPSENRKNG